MGLKSDKHGVQLCICGRSEKERKSFFGKFDVVCGWIVLVVLSVVLLFLKAIDVLLVVVLPLLILTWLTFFIIWLTKKHSLKCAARWATVVVVGAVGGSWFLGF